MAAPHLLQHDSGHHHQQMGNAYVDHNQHPQASCHQKKPKEMLAYMEMHHHSYAHHNPYHNHHHHNHPHHHHLHLPPLHHTQLSPSHHHLAAHHPLASADHPPNLQWTLFCSHHRGRFHYHYSESHYHLVLVYEHE